ncbi:MAG: membrane protein insertase YidC [Propionibacteriaceae bacterium]|nr:membrane protein insertase YidC [Propionibacteriaceae bacterium]
MHVIDIVLGTPLGYLLYWCYQLFGNYGVAIIAFTVLTKVILFPLSLLSQKNAITMVRIKPALEDLKRRFEGNNTLLLEEQRQLYKSEHYSALKGALPMLIQIPLILGLIQVIYHPLHHLLHISSSTIGKLVAETARLMGTTPDALGMGAEVHVLEQVQLNPAAFAGLADDVTLDRIGQVHLHFLGLNLAETPALTSPTVVYPILSALSALALCLYQNRYYVLQKFAGPVSKWGITAFLVAFSGYFALVLPCGFGLYWTAGNLLSIAVVWLCNVAMDPRQSIDYGAIPVKPKLTRAEKAAARTEQQAAKAKERADLKRFNQAGDKGLVFYSEGSGFWKYFARTIGYLRDHSDVTVHYVTSDPHDAVFKRQDDRLQAYYVGPKKLIPFMMRLDADVVVMTMPDLGKYHIKRSLVRSDIEYVYLDHGMASLHLMLREGALDHFDTVFCYGPNHIDEVRQTEAAYGLPAKRLVQTGYGLLDDLLESVAALGADVHNDPPIALIAPSWQPGNILESCPEEVVRPLLDEGFRVIVRPHPEFVKRFGDKLRALQERFAGEPADRFELQTDFSSNQTVYTADVVVTDWSTIAQEFSYATKKPSIFVNTPMKIMNPNYGKIAAVPLEIALRDEIGRSLDLDQLATIGIVATDMVDHPEAWRDRITAVMERWIYHIGCSEEFAGGYLLAALARHERARQVAAAQSAQRLGRATEAQKLLLAEAARDREKAAAEQLREQAEGLDRAAAELRQRADQLDAALDAAPDPALAPALAGEA